MNKPRVEELADLLEVDPEGLSLVEAAFTQGILESIVGKKIASALVEETRIALTMDDGTRIFFYGFIGKDGQATP